MRRLLPLLLLCATTATATADGFYFTESFGGTRAKDEVAPYLDDAFRLRLSLGTRHRNYAVEGWIAAAIASHGVIADGPYSNQPAYDGECLDCAHPQPGYYAPTSLTTYGVDFKYINPLSKNLEVYLKGTISGGQGDGRLDGYGGRGLGVGAGAQLKGRVPVLGFLWFPLFFVNAGPKCTAALWVDTSYEFYRLQHDYKATVDAQLSHVTFGFAVGSDF